MLSVLWSDRGRGRLAVGVYGRAASRTGVFLFLTSVSLTFTRSSPTSTIG